MTSFTLYRQAQARAWAGLVNWASDSIVMTQHTAAYVPDLDTDAYVSSLTSEVLTGNGYTQGGITLSDRGVQYYPANAWPDSWSPSQAYVYGQVVRPQALNGWVYRCITAGTSGTGQPSWPVTAGATVSDGAVTWAATAQGAVALQASSVTWAGYSGSFRYLVISDRTAGLASAQPLLAIADMGTTTTGTGGNLDVIFDQAGVAALWAS
jgi:hypothetical protein